jgi:ABC-2 type transport system permease protein
VRTDDALIRTSEPPRLRMTERVRELWASREILVNLSRKELRVKYKSSLLGIVWSMLSPMLYLVVFYVVFTFFLPTRTKDFPVYLLSGLIPWTLFSATVLRGTEVIVGNAQLITKVAFPREVLPLAVVGANLVNFAFQLAVLLLFMLVFAYPFLGWNLVLLPLSLIVLLLFTSALILFTSAFNVRYRDITYLVELALLAWFWSTPIVYPTTFLEGRVLDLYLLNPLTNIVLGFQRAMYGGTDPEHLASLPTGDLSWYLIRLGIIGAVSLGFLYVGWRAFFRLSGDFAEEL